jgi:hypothetical protein
MLDGDGFGNFGPDGGNPIGPDAAAAPGGDALFATGGAGAGAGTVYAARMTATDLGNFQAAGTLVTPRYAAGAIVLGDWLYVLGGFDAAGTAALANVERARLE